jgi:hypothetical protein
VHLPRRYAQQAITHQFGYSCIGIAFNIQTLVPLGGDGRMVFNFELRYPLTRRLPLAPLYDLS